MGSNPLVLWEIIVEIQLIAKASSGLVSLVAPESRTPEHCPERATLIFGCHCSFSPVGQHGLNYLEERLA